jgi:23S rRNA (guanosine2251-2'-O)-methyltransferase
MSQRKQKPGKPGNRPLKGPQQSDRKDRIPAGRGPGKGAGERPQGDRPKWSKNRPDADQGRKRSDRPGMAKRFEPDMAAPHPGTRRNDRAPRPDAEKTGHREDGHRREASSGRGRQEHTGGKGQLSYWLFGHHAVEAALLNPKRQIQRLVHLSGESDQSGDARIPIDPPALDRLLPPWEPIDRTGLNRLLPEGAVHQGVAARVAILPEVDLYEICDLAAARDNAIVMILDQVTDPHNVGAILRSAAAFGALAVILTERHAAPESGTLAKSASGALEHVPLVRVSNLARAMGQLKEAGFWLAGLAAEGKSSLAKAKLSGKVGLVLGAEGPGLRRLTRDHCDLLVSLPTAGPIGHLNVSNAAAVALYEMVRETT